MMPKIHRLTGRFFTVLISLSIAICLPRVAYGSTKSPAPTLCQISDTVYRADGSPAHGTVLISWQAFTTAAGQAVSPGSLLVTLDAQGGFNASLAPNTGASPAGTYYKALFKLSDGTTETEYWVVPNTQTTTIGAIRSKLVPAQQAAQFLTRDYADSTYVSLASTQTISGVKTFSTSPAVPTPQNPTDAANKSYVDNNSGGAQLLGQANTWSARQTFSVSPAVPTPQSGTDAANKSYVDANSGGNLSSPPPIGNVAPNTGTFTTLDNIPNAAAFSGSDACAKINAAVASLPATGGTVDARGFTAPATCATTINLNLPNLTLLLPAVTLTLNGNPGINVSAAHVTIACSAGTEGDLYGTVPPNLKSGGAYPLIADTVQSFHATDGFTLRNCYLEGNSTGTFGLFLPYGSSGHLENVYTRGFTSVGQFILGGQWTSWASSSGGNGGDGLVWGYDGAINGNPQFAGNGGTAVHLVSGGNDLNGVGTYKNRLHGIYIDGTQGGDWRASAAYVQQGFIRPTSGNAGNFAFFTQVPGTTGSARPTFCQTPGCTFSDGSVVWINAGTAYGYTPLSIFASAWWSFLKSINSASNGYQAPAGFDADDIRIEGSPTTYALQNSILSAKVRQSEANDWPAHGIHLIYTSTTTMEDIQWIGAGYSNRPDLGAVLVSNSYFASINGINCYASYANCVQIAGSTDTVISDFISQNGALAGTPTPQTYALSVDANSAVVMVEDLDVDDNRSTPYSRGVSNAGSNLVVKNERYNNLASSPDSGAYTAEFFSIINSNVYYNVPGGGGWQYSIGGAHALGINPNGVNIDTGLSVGGALTYQSVAGVQFLVSHYGSIQGAINAAAGSGQVTGVVVDDRTSAYTGAGFNIPDSVTLQLAPVSYTINATTTFNNGNNNVTAGIILQPGARLIGAGTSSNHGTILSAANGLNADLIATSTVGTGTGSSVQWWHWGEIGNLRIVGNGTNQTVGDCVKIENMGETARVHDIELSGCYLNNLEIIGASATQSAVNNITSNRATTGSGAAFTNLSGVAVLNGVSGDCNQTALINANFNAAGTLNINGLKAEAESSICPSGVQDPVILTTTTSGGASGSVNLSGGYAFGTAQQNFLKNTGPGTIQFTETNFYLNGYANIVNDTTRSTVIANVATTMKQPVSYLSNGIVFGNQAFTFQPNTFMQGNPNGTPTEMFGAGSDGSTDIAAIGNGDNAKYFTGGVKFGTFNRAVFGQTPEYQARMGWRWTNPGYDTTTWTFIPIWATGDSSARWIGDPNVRWPEIYASDVNSTTATVGTLNVTTCNGCGGSFQQVNSDWNASSGVSQILNKPSLAAVATSGSYNDLSNKPSFTGTGACGINQFETSDNVGVGPTCAQVQYSQLGGSPTTSHLVSGTMQGNTATLTGNNADQTIYTATLPAGAFTVGTGVHCWAKWQHTTSGSTSITYKWTLGSTAEAYAGFTSASQSVSSDIEVLTPASLSSQIINLSAVIAGNGFQAGQSYGNAGSENLANADTIKLTFNAGSGEQVKGMSFYCQTVQ